MGKRGPLPKKVVRRKNKRTISASVAVGVPECPAGLTGVAREHWEKIVPLLDEMDIITTADGDILERYCRAWATWRDLDAMIQQTSLLITGRGGDLVRNPLWLLRRDAAAEVTELGKDLGLSPVGRLRAGIKHERETDETPAGVTAIDDYRQRLGG